MYFLIFIFSEIFYSKLRLTLSVSITVIILHGKRYSLNGIFGIKFPVCQTGYRFMKFARFKTLSGEG